MAGMNAIMLRKMRSVGERLAALATLKGFRVLPVDLLCMHHVVGFVLKDLQQAVQELCALAISPLKCSVLDTQTYSPTPQSPED